MSSARQSATGAGLSRKGLNPAAVPFSSEGASAVAIARKLVRLSPLPKKESGGTFKKGFSPHHVTHRDPESSPSPSPSESVVESAPEEKRW